MSELSYHAVAKVGEIVEGRGLPVEIEGRAIAVFLNDGEYFAVDDFCPHKGAPLHDGLVFDRSVTCLLHGWRFCLETGHRLEGLRTWIDTYPARVVGDEIQVGVPS